MTADTLPMMRRLTVLAAALLLSTVLHATVYIPIEFRELVTTSPVIVHGRVVDVHAAWVDGRRSIETFVTLEADDYLRGNLGHELTFRVPGGALGRYRTIVVGAPTFAAGDEVVLFLQSGAGPYPWVVGLSQGAFRVVSVPGTATPLVTPPMVMAKSSGDTVPIVRGTVARRPMPIAQFRDAVRQVLAQAGAR